MAGTNADFDATDFVDGIHLAMEMGAAINPDERAVFYFPRQLIYTGSKDGEGVPFDINSTVVTQSLPPVRNVPCSIEYFDAQGAPVAFGTVTPSRLDILLLDEDYKKIKGCAYVVVAGDKYVYARTLPPSGLFDVGIYTLVFKAEDEN